MNASDLARAALVYARIGWRVHPCRPGEKLPILDAWQKRATADPDMITRWWSRTPEANIAVVTGSGSRIFVLDVDGPEGERSLVELERRPGPLPETFPMSWTGGGRGGWQAFFAYPQGRQIRNSAGRLGPKLDTRGEGGFVVLPPSRTQYSYRWETDRNPIELPPAPAPNWLVDLLDPPVQERESYAYAPEPSDDRYVLRALEAELALVASAPNGRRNAQLNESAFNLFRFVIDDRLAPDAIVHSLEGAARHAGLDGIEIRSTIRSAAQARGVPI